MKREDQETIVINTRLGEFDAWRMDRERERLGLRRAAFVRDAIREKLGEPRPQELALYRKEREVTVTKQTGGSGSSTGTKPSERVPLHTTAGPCPSCGRVEDAMGPALLISKARGTWVCNGCGATGSLYEEGSGS